MESIVFLPKTTYNYANIYNVSADTRHWELNGMGKALGRKSYFIILSSAVFYVLLYMSVKLKREGDEVKIPVLLRKILFPLLGQEKVSIGLSIMTGYLMVSNIVFYGLKLTICKLYSWSDLNVAWFLLFNLFVLVGRIFSVTKEALDETAKISWGKSLIEWTGVIILLLITVGYLIFLLLLCFFKWGQ